MSKVWLVGKWEFARFFKPKQELISYLVMIGIFALIWAVQAWQVTSTQQSATLLVSGSVPELVSEEFSLQTASEDVSEDNARVWLEDENIDGVLIAEASSARYQLYVSEQANWQSKLETLLFEHHQSDMLEELNLTREQLESIKEPLTFTLVNQAQEDIGGEFKSLGMIVVVLVTVAVFTSFGLAFTSVTTEKMQRITEQMLTCVTPQQWIDGKTVGICLMSVKSLVTTTLSFLLIFAGIAVFNGEAMSMGFTAPWYLIVQILLFMVLGILFWNYLFTGFAATIDDPNHSGKTGVMLLPIIPVMLVFTSMSEPGGQVATILSILPLTSISFMPMRLASMDVPFMQYLVSLLFLFGSVYLVRLFATRIFRANISLYGKEPGWGEIWRAMLKKN